MWNAFTAGTVKQLQPCRNRTAARLIAKGLQVGSGDSATSVNGSQTPTRELANLPSRVRPSVEMSVFENADGTGRRETG